MRGSLPGLLGSYLKDPSSGFSLSRKSCAAITAARGLSELADPEGPPLDFAASSSIGDGTSFCSTIVVIGGLEDAPTYVSGIRIPEAELALLGEKTDFGVA